VSKVGDLEVKCFDLQSSAPKVGRLEAKNFWYETWSQEHNVFGIQKHIAFDAI
jgi:hypothetical protein